MARGTGLAVTTIKALEDERIALPSRDTLGVVADAYGVPYEDLARAAYGTYYEESDESPDSPAKATPPSMKEPALAH